MIVENQILSGNQALNLLLNGIASVSSGVSSQPDSCTHNKFSVTATAAIIVPAALLSKGCTVKALTGSAWDMGKIGVTALNGFPMEPGDVVNVRGNYDLYAIGNGGKGAYFMEVTSA